jgi:hypothetical protein
MSKSTSTVATIGETASSPTLESAGDQKTVVIDNLEPIYSVTAGLDVHKASISACVRKKVDGKFKSEVRTFGVFKCELRTLADWLLENYVEVVVVESTGIYSRSPFDILQEAGLNVMMVNSYEVKNVPGRKTDTTDCQWLATLAMSGLLRKSRILDKDRHELREMSRLRQSYVESVTRLKNKGYKLLTGAGFNVSVILSDLYGRTGRLVMDGLMNGLSSELILQNIKDSVGYRLKAPKQDLIDALDGKMSYILKAELESILFMIDTYQGQIKKLDEDLRLY